MSTSNPSIIAFKDVRRGDVFEIVSERGRSAPTKGRYVKCGNSHANAATNHAKTIILALGDVVRIINRREDFTNGHSRRGR